MPAPRIDLARKIKNILQHVKPLPIEAATPLGHYYRTTADVWRTYQHIEESLAETGPYPAVTRRHLGRLNLMMLVHLIEAFERFLKETAAVCVDALAEYLLDDRLNVFRISGATLAAHFGTDTLGKSLCESGTWLECEDINDRFRKLLADPFQQGGGFHLFPRPNQQPAAETWRFATLNLVWQIRHTVVHNVGVITQSDAVKLRLWAREEIAAPLLLQPSRDDLLYLKRFLDDTAASSNRRVGERLAELLTTIHAAGTPLRSPQRSADTLTQVFGFSLSVAGVAGRP